LYTIPCTNYRIDPSGWPQLPDCLNDGLEFVQSPPATAIPTGATLVSVRHQVITSREDLRNLQLPHKDVDRIRDPSSDKRHLSNNSARILKMFLHWLQNVSPMVSLCPQPLWKGEAASDAFANSDVCGFGSFIRTSSNQCIWFSERFVKADFTREDIPVDDTLQKIISALELLAQMASVWAVAQLYPGHRIPIRGSSFSDNTGAESGSNKLFIMKFPQCLFMEKLCLLPATFSMELDIQHIAGKLNDEADALSRWSGVDAIPFSSQESDRVRISLSDLWIPRFAPQKFPSDAFLLWQLPSV